MKQYIAKILLRILNTNYLNGTPCKYMLVNGYDAVTYEELRYEVKDNPHVMVRDVLNIIDKMRSCPITPHTHDKEGIRPMNDQDIKDLQNL